MSSKMRSAYFAAALSAVLTVAAVASAKYQASNPQISVHAKGPLGLSIEGKSSKLVVDETDTTVTFKTFLNTIDTGNGMRNTHMVKRLGHKVNDDGSEADVLEIKLSIPKDKIGKGGTVPGTLNFHGMSKPVTVNYKVDGKHVTANFEFNVHNHFQVNKHFTEDDKKNVLCNTGVCAKPEVKVDVSFDLKD